jgi:DNA-binding NtrC family response regulator
MNKLLIVDDDEEVRKSLVILLRTKLEEISRESDTEIYACHDLDAVAELGPKLAGLRAAFIDKNLANGRIGDEVARYIKQNLHTRSAVVVLITNDPGRENFKGEGQAGSSVDRYIPKRNLKNELNLQILLGDRPRPRNREVVSEEDLHPDVDTQWLEAYIRDIVGPSMMTVTLIGEAGTGKEKWARFIHQSSGLPSHNYRAVNCATLQGGSAASELFGHVKGSFTDAQNHRAGLVLEAAGIHFLEGKDSKSFIDFLKLSKVDLNQDEAGNWLLCKKGKEPQFTGSLFLDEIGDLERGLQGGALRLLNGDGIRPVGFAGGSIIPKVRIIAATNNEEIVRPAATKDSQPDRSFRSDLWSRISPWVIYLKPLKERPADAVKIALQRISAFAAAHADCKLRFNPNSESANYILDLVQQGHFSEVGGLLGGNIRGFLHFIDRACWLTWKQYPSANELTSAELEAAAYPRDVERIMKNAEARRLEQPSSSPSPRGPEKPDYLSLCKGVYESQFLREAVKDSSEQNEIPSQREADVALATAIRDLVYHEHLNRAVENPLDVIKCVKSPDTWLGVGLCPDELHARWRTLCVVGILAALSKKDRKYFDITLPRQQPDKLRNTITELLYEEQIDVRWAKSKQRQPCGTLAHFLGLIYDQSNADVLAAAPSRFSIAEKLSKPDDLETSGTSEFAWRTSDPNIRRKTQAHLRSLAELCDLLHIEKGCLK